jgi:predicted ABC-type ATPase
MEITIKYRSKNLFVVIIHGHMGAGKTALADLLHDEIADTAHFGADHIKWLVSDFRNVSSHTKVAKNMIPIMADGYLTQGINLILEQAFSAEEIKSLELIAQKFGAKFLVYGLNADRSILSKRIIERTQRLGKPEIPTTHVDKSYEEYKRNMHEGGGFFDSEKISIREMSDVILKDLGLKS